MLEAFTIQQKLPQDRHFVKKVTTAWPAQPLTEFHEMVGWDEGETRRRVWDGFANAKGAFSYEISRMEEAQDWLRFVPEGERRCLLAWAIGTVKAISIKKILRKHGGWTKTTFYRAINSGAARIAERLNREGVQVR
jgi:hypothetical protein